MQMPKSRSKYSDAAVSRRRNTVRDVLLGIAVGLAVIFVIMAGRFIYGKSKDPNYRIADLFGKTTAGTLPTLPTFPIDSLEIPSSSETLPYDSTEETAGDSSEQPTEETTEETSAETTEETSPEETSAEPTSEEQTTTEPDKESTETPSESTSEEATGPDGTTADETAPETTDPEETTPEETTPEETTAPVIVSDPTDINYHLIRYNMDEDDLGDCRQLVTVQSSGTQCTLYFFDKGNDGWALSEAIPSAPGIVGRGGVTTSKQEGDGCTPAGYYALGPCYGEDAKSATAMEYHQIVKGDFWVDDPNSQYYNQFVHLDDILVDRPEWTSGEDLFELLRYYRYMVVIRYNMDPIVPGAGSAIFLHCQAGDTTTSGCVSTKEATVFAILRWLDPAADPHILIY